MTVKRRVVVVGAGMGGLAASIALSARGFHVTTLDAADGPGGKMREVEAGGRLIDAGPTVLTMRWVFEQIFEDAGASPVSATRLESDRCDSPAMPGATARASISIPTSTKARMRSRISPGRARRMAIAVFANAPSAIYRDSPRHLHPRIETRPRRTRNAGRTLAPPRSHAGYRRSRHCRARSKIISRIPGCASCSGATPPIAARRHSSLRQR